VPLIKKMQIPKPSVASDVPVTVAECSRYGNLCHMTDKTIWYLPAGFGSLDKLSNKYKAVGYTPNCQGPTNLVSENLI
jgi:hypothetical protein